MRNQVNNHFRPPALTGLYALFWGWLALAAFNAKYTWSAAGALASGGMMVGQVIRFCDDFEKLRQYRQRLKGFRASAKDHGQSGYASKKQIVESGLISRHGLFLGSTPTGKRTSADLRYDGEGSGVIISPPGGSKTTACLCPTLLSDPGNFIVHDPTLQLYCLTHEHRRETLNNEIVLICPWEEEASEIAGYDVKDSGIRFMSMVDFKNKPTMVREDVKALFELLLPDRFKTDAKTRYFERDGRALLEFLTLDILNLGVEPTLPMIRNRLLSGHEMLREAFADAMESDAFSGELALLANGLHGMMVGSGPQFQGGFGTAAQCIELYDNYSPVARHVTRPGFDPASFNGDRNVTVYVCYPGERIKTHHRMAAATFSFLFQQICKRPGGKPVTALIEEAAELGNWPFIRYMNIGRKFNLRVFTVWQDLFGQLQEIVGPDGLRQFIPACDLMWITSARGYENCDLISKMIGMKAIENLSLNDRVQDTSPMPDLSLGRSHSSVPHLRAEDVQRLPQDQVLVMHGNNHPILATKVPYFRRPEFASAAGHDPYRGKI